MKSKHATSSRNHARTCSPHRCRCRYRKPRWLGAALGVALVVAAESAVAQSAAQFHYGTMGAPYNQGRRPVLLSGIQFRDVRLRNSIYTLSNRVFSTTGISAHNHIKTMSFGRAGLLQAHGLRFYGPYTMRDDADTRADESLHAHAIYTSSSTSPILYMGFKTWTGRFMMAVNGGGGDLKIGGQTSIADSSKTPWETMALVDLNGGRLRSGEWVGFKTPTGHWLRQYGQYVRADAPRAMLGVYFRIYKVGGTGNIEHGDRFNLIAMNGRYVRSFGNYATANATSPLAYGTFTLERTSIDSMRLGQEIVTQTRTRYGTSFRGLDSNRNGVLEWHECAMMMFLANPMTSNCGANRSFGTSTVPGESGLRISTRLVYVGDETNIATLTHELIHNLGAIDTYGAGARSNRLVSLMGATCSNTLNERVHLDPWHKMRLGWVQPRIIDMRNRNSAEVVRATVSSVASWENRPIILYDPARYNLTARSGEFFMIEARKRKTGYYDENLASEGVAVWQIKTDGNGVLLDIPAVGRSGSDKTCNLLSADGVRGGNVLFRQTDGIITPRYIDGTAAPVRLRVSRPWSTQQERAVVEISRDGRMRPEITFAGGSLTRGGSLTLFGELSPQSAAGTQIYLMATSTTTLYPTYLSTYIRTTIPSYLPAGNYWVRVRQWGKYSNFRMITIR